MMLRVNEMFATIQGEGYWSGTPAVFIRLQGCPVGCPWCDTKHTWPTSPLKHVDRHVMIAKTLPSPTWADMDPEHVVEFCERLFPPRHYVITGGEPAAQDIYQLTVQLGRLGRVQLETSGTHDVNVSTDTWVTVSPKFDMPGGLDVLPEALHRANEIKMPVTCQADIDRLLPVLTEETRRKVALQPVDLDEAATELCIQQCVKHGWRLSLQTHKLIGLR